MDDHQQRRVTSISPTKRDPQRVSVRVAGRTVATLQTKAATRLNLAVGMVWDEAVERVVLEAAAEDRAMRDALRRVERRMLSRRMLEIKLRQRGHAPAAIEPVLERLEAMGAVDDRAFGEALIRQMRSQKPAGPRLVRQKLMQKGLAGELIDDLVAEAFADHDQSADAIDLATRKLASMMRLDADTKRRRLWSHLARRGFDSDTIREAMNAVEREIGGDADETF